MSIEHTQNLMYQTGIGSLVFCQVMPSDGKSGRDDPEGKGRIHLFPSTWPDTLDSNKSLWGHVMSQNPMGPFGSTVHHMLLDGLRVACTINHEGVPFIHCIFASETGPEMREGFTQRGEETYVGACTMQGK